MKILLVCSAGMSTSMVVKKMQAEAEAQGLDAKIWAVGAATAKEESQGVDIILLGPQVRFMEKQVKAFAGDTPVMVMDMMEYGRLDGKAILDKAVKVING